MYSNTLIKLYGAKRQGLYRFCHLATLLAEGEGVDGVNTVNCCIV